MEELIIKIKELYPNVKFEEGNENGNEILLYSNRDLMWDDNFSNKVLELAEKYLKENEYNSFAYVYENLTGYSNSKIEKLQEKLSKNMSKSVELAEKNSPRNEKGQVVLKKEDEWRSEEDEDI